MSETMTQEVRLGSVDPVLLFGHNDVHLVELEKRYGVRLIGRGRQIKIEGDPRAVEQVAGFVEELSRLVAAGQVLDKRDFASALRYLEDGTAVAPSPDAVVLATKRGVVRPKSLGQQLYVSAVRACDVVFSIGPAGTGKTYLAVALAVAALKNREVSRIVLTRPAVEAGEHLGFLPGDFQEKVDPYLRPLYDALHDMLAQDKLRQFLEVKVVEVVPLAYMRGRTLNNAFTILDEAQNTTPNQMKMFLTRLGVGSKAIITGDITQVDLPEQQVSGLVQVQSVLSGLKGAKFVYLTELDVVRHQLVQEIIKAYERFEQAADQAQAKPASKADA